MNTRMPALLLPAALLLAGCVITPPPAPPLAMDPSCANAPEASTGRYRPSLVATTKTYLSPAEGAGAQQMSGMHMEGGAKGMDHGSMAGMSHGAHGKAETAHEPAHGEMHGMHMASPDAAGAPRNPAEKVTAAEQAQTGAPPKGAQLQSTHPAFYTCPMHPQIKSSKPGKCPICGMTLVARQAAPNQPATEKPENAPHHNNH